MSKRHPGRNYLPRSEGCPDSGSQRPRHVRKHQGNASPGTRVPVNAATECHFSISTDHALPGSPARVSRWVMLIKSRVLAGPQRNIEIEWRPEEFPKNRVGS